MISLMTGALVLFAFWSYVRTLLQQKEEINVGTWFILAYGDALELSSYFVMTEKWWLNIVPLAFAVGSISTFLIALRLKMFGPIRRIDVFCVVADIGITVLWAWLSATDAVFSASIADRSRTFDAPTIANLAYQLSAVIAFVPMWWSQVRGREVEPPIPWLLWTAAFGIFTVIAAYEHNKLEELVYPGLNLFIQYMIASTALVAARNTVRSQTSLR
jgi:hypothetical protein